jgi:LuxR family maltose regulon positive regulatory protein
MMDHGELTTLVAWFDALPGEMIRSQPWLCVAYAWALIYTGQVNALDPLLLDAEESLRDLSTKQAGSDVRAAGHISAIRAYTLVLRGNMSRGARLAREALGLLPEQDLTARSWTVSLLANALRWSGNLAAADRTFAKASAITQKVGGSHVAVDVLCDWAGLQIMQGQLHKAAATCQDALALADDYVAQSGRRLPVTGYAHIRLSVVLRQWNDLEAALRHAREGIHLSEQWGWTESLVGGYISLAKVLDAMGDTDGALDATQKVRRVARGVSRWFEAYTAALEARLWLAQGNTEAAYRWASQESGLSVDDEAGFEYEFVYLTLARIRIAQGRLDEALEMLASLLEAAEPAGAMGYGIEILILQALALHVQGKMDRALSALDRALSLAEPQGYVRAFIDEGAPMGELLRQAVAQGIAVDYVSKLLAALGAEEQEARPSTGTQLAEPLTERELEVLRLLVVGLPNKEIARTLVIAVGTVKQHLKNIYGKLEVHNRTEAANRARDLGLV